MSEYLCGVYATIFLVVLCMYRDVIKDKQSIVVGDIVIYIIFSLLSWVGFTFISLVSITEFFELYGQRLKKFIVKILSYTVIKGGNFNE